MSWNVRGEERQGGILVRLETQISMQFPWLVFRLDKFGY